MHLDLAPYFVLSILLIVAPGPDTAMVTKNALFGGRRRGIFCAVGVAVGLAIWTVAAALGLAALLHASSVAFFALKLAGALYLVWVGVQMLRSRGLDSTDGEMRTLDRRGAKKAMRQGLLCDLGNPKVGVFFTSFLPQFVHGDGSAFLSLVVLGLIFCVLTFAWLTLYAAVIGRGSSFLRRPRVRLWLDRFTGVVFVGFGIRLALEKR
jgi:RhtB (resistance to homoserine/threonine) family protein